MAFVVLSSSAMARRVEELAVWQLGHELRQRVYELTARPPQVADLKFRDQLRDAASSVTRNIAEGFGRYQPRQFAQFLNVARGSLFEVIDHLRDGAERHYWTDDEVRDAHRLCRRTISALTRFIRYLKTAEPPTG